MKVFIDGSAGTTGLRIRERLSRRTDLTLLEIPEALRKDVSARRECLNDADVAFLCLPDAAAEEAVALIGNPDTAVIDTSTAHRTAPGWVYGFAELPGQREAIAGSKRIANPGCHASGFIALAAPLVQAGLIAKDAPLTCFSLTGYSGGGKKMIAEYEGEARSPLLDAPDEAGFLSASALSGRDDMEISVCGCEERLILTARFDNLGKGASGAAIQNMNILMGAAQETGLVLGKEQ